MKKILTILLLCLTWSLQAQLIFQNGHVYYYNNTTHVWTACDTTLARLVGLTATNVSHWNTAYSHSHEQGTDGGTNLNYFDIGGSNGHGSIHLEPGIVTGGDADVYLHMQDITGDYRMDLVLPNDMTIPNYGYYSFDTLTGRWWVRQLVASVAFPGFGTSHSKAAYGDHNHDGVYLPNSFNGNRTVTRAGLPAINTGDTTLIGWLNNYFFPSTYPASAISVSGGTSREFMAGGANLNVSLTWSVTRPVACTAITSIVIDGVSQTLDNPFIEGHTQSGVLNNRSLPRNTITSFSNIATSADKSTTTTTTINWYNGRYWGSFLSAVPPTDITFSISDAQIIALTGAGVGSGFELSTTRAKTYNGINGGGNYLVFAFPSGWGTPVFMVNGLISTAFTMVRNSPFTNASGATTLNYQVWVSNTIQTSAITQFQIQ